MKYDEENTFPYLLEQFADVRIMAFTVPGFDKLSKKQKILLYFLSQAALCGRDILYDQHFKHNLRIRKTLEGIYRHYTGDRKDKHFRDFVVYLKRVWFSNGIHHHYSTDKFFPEFSRGFFETLVRSSKDAVFPLKQGQDLNAFIQEITGFMFDRDFASKRVSLDSSRDLLVESACNFYEKVTQKEAEEFYRKMNIPEDPHPPSYGLNSRLIKKAGKITEETYQDGGKYSAAIRKILYWLDQAREYAENTNQRTVIEKLISFYRSGNLRTFDEYSVRWVNDLESSVDFVNGFIEVYGDPLGIKATWESVVNFKDDEATKRTEIISANAQWFEDHSPVNDRFRKKEVKGVSAKVITVVQLGGDCYPATPIGINLPNADWIRKEHGSKSVTMENITYAYDQASKESGFLEEFCYSEEEIMLARKYGNMAGNLHTDLHECLGHGSGQLLPGVSPEALKNYGSVLEEARADLFALYYIMDPKMIELEIMPNLDVAKTEYNGYIRNGLITQLTRIEPGKNIEQAHMRNRKLVATWCYENGRKQGVIEILKRDEKTFCKINDYRALRRLFGVLLAEVQRIKSEGDYESAKRLVETFGIQVDPVLHKEVKVRFEKLNIAPYGGFVNPVLNPVIEDEKIVDVQLTYPESYTDQMLHYSETHSFLDPLGE